MRNQRRQRRGIADASAEQRDPQQAQPDLVFAGSHGNADFVNLVYKNVVAPPTGDLAYYQGILDCGEMTQAQLAMLAAQTNLDVARSDLVGLAQTGIDFIRAG